MVPGGTCADIPRTLSPAKSSREKRKVNVIGVFRLPFTSKYNDWKFQIPQFWGKALSLNMANSNCA